MRSTSLLPAIYEMPTDASGNRKSYCELMTDLMDSERILRAAEVASAASLALWGVHSHVNVDDRLFEAYEMAYPALAADRSLHEHYLHMLEAGDSAQRGFISGLKGKLAELDAKDILQQQGYTNVEIAANPTQSAWDISAVNSEGEQELFQVKTGAENYAYQVSDALEAQPDINFMVSSEIYNRIVDTSPASIDRLIDIGYDYTSADEITHGLTVLSDNMGIDVSDGIGEIVPFLGVGIAGTRVTYNVIKTEGEFRHIDRVTRNKVQIAKNVPLAFRIGTPVVSAIAGTILVPVPLVGTVAGFALGLYIAKRLVAPVSQEVQRILKLTPDDLFYYKNKIRIDEVATRFHETARSLGAAN